MWDKRTHSLSTMPKYMTQGQWGQKGGIPVKNSLTSTASLGTNSHNQREKLSQCLILFPERAEEIWWVWVQKNKNREATDDACGGEVLVTHESDSQFGGYTLC